MEQKKRGRPKFEKSTPQRIRFPDAIWEKIPSKKAEYVREAVEEKLKRDSSTI